MRERIYIIRPYRPSDNDAAYEVCLKTGDSGADGTHLYPDDHRALGRIYVGPYLRFEPELSFVLEDSVGVCGYVLAALDSESFYRHYHQEWLPPVRARYPSPSGNPDAWTPTQRLYYEYHHPETYYPPEFRIYPSHLHIDLMPRVQGHGLGAPMIRLMLDCLAVKGSPGVHLCMSEVNARAFKFYLKLGFKELVRRGTGESAVIFMGLPLYPACPETPES